LEGPHQRQVDLSLFKSFALTETLKMQFRAECYNISNTPNFAQPVHDYSTVTPDPEHPGQLLPGNFGKIQYVTQGTFPRVWQFALKLNF
jgi:hypothetical protein